MKKLIVEIEFDEEQDEFDDFTSLEFSSMKIGSTSTVTEDERARLAETWGQSDWYSVGFVNALLAVLDGAKIEAKDVRPY